MTTYYVGPGGNNANSGTSWAQRKLTLNGAEDIPVAAGDIVYVGPGTYRETLTVDVSGTAGNPITYIGDYTGANTDGVGGTVRITGSDNDQTETRSSCITSSNKNYRTFQGFMMDMATGNLIVCSSGVTNWTVDKCFLIPGNIFAVDFGGVSSNVILSNSIFLGSHSGAILVRFTHSSTTTSTGSLVQNCIFIGGSAQFSTARVDGIAIKNSLFLSGRTSGIQIATSLAGGNSITVNNCILTGCLTALNANVSGEIVENYNAFFNNGTNRTNTATGANSNAFPALFDPRWFFELVTNTAGPNSTTQVITPFDLASFSTLLNVAGTSPTTTDMRGTAVQGSQREWGVLEYDSTLKIEGGSASAGGISRARVQG
jgi:hypothetical protein